MPVRDQTVSGIIRRNSDIDQITHDHFDIEFFHFAAEACFHIHSVFQSDVINAPTGHITDLPTESDEIVFCHA